MRRIRDISQRLNPELPVWPGEPPLSLYRTAEIRGDCPVNVSVLTLSSHAGSHADAPLHYDPSGRAVADCVLEPYVGPCRVFDVRRARGLVTLADFDLHQVAQGDRVLFRTYERFPSDAWDSRFTAMAPEVVEALGERGVVLIGTDAASLDPEHSKSMDAHRAVMRHDMRILEGLVLDDVPAGEYELIALPLKLEGADASPVRAILRELK